MHIPDERNDPALEVQSEEAEAMEHFKIADIDEIFLANRPAQTPNEKNRYDVCFESRDDNYSEVLKSFSSIGLAERWLSDKFPTYKEVASTTPNRRYFRPIDY